MQNAHAVSRPESPVLSNGALVSALSLIICRYRKMDKTIHGNWVCIQSAFSAYRTQFTEKPSAPKFGLETALRFYIYFVFVHDLCLWNTYELVRRNA
jgi:hypothetical protein